MSDEGRLYVKSHSPFTGTTFWIHYVLGDLANLQHGYEIFIGNKRLTEEWPVSARAVARAMAELVEGGYLEALGTPAPGRPARYRFVFLGAETIARQPGTRSGNARQPGTRTRAKSDSTPIANPKREQKQLAPTGAEVVADPLSRTAHQLTVLAFEQPVKPELRDGGKGAFPAALGIIERVLRSGVPVASVQAAIETGVDVWTLAGLQTAVAKVNPRARARQGNPIRRDGTPGKSLLQLAADLAADTRSTG